LPLHEWVSQRLSRFEIFYLLSVSILNEKGSGASFRTAVKAVPTQFAFAGIGVAFV